VAEALRALGLAADPFATANIVASTFLIPEGQTVGPAAPYPGYAGVERDFGRYTVSHAGTPPIDQYAYRKALEWWVVPKVGDTPDARTPGELVGTGS